MSAPRPRYGWTSRRQQAFELRQATVALTGDMGVLLRAAERLSDVIEAFAAICALDDRLDRRSDLWGQIMELER